MQTHYPSWFLTLVDDPQTMHAHMQQKFSTNDYPADVAPNALTELFGRLNQTKVETFLSSSLQTIYRRGLNAQKKRTLTLLNASLNQLAKELPLDLHFFSSYYPITLFSSDNLLDCALREIAEYVFSLPMPMQEGRVLRCHTIAAVERNLSEHQRELEEAITRLYQRTLPEAQGEPLNLRQEQLLFKHAALVGQGKIMSWGNMLILWLRVSTTGQSKIEEFSASLRFDKLLAPGSLQNQSGNLLPAGSFQNFVIDQALSMLFKHPRSLIPRGVAEDSIRQIMQQSTRAIQDLVFFVDYLHRQPNDFPFNEAFLSLKNLIADQTDETYRFLSACIYFLNCKHKLHIKEQEEPLLFSAILSLVESKANICEKMIVQDLAKKPVFVEELLQLTERFQLHPHECAIIAIKSACTSQKSDDSPPSTFMDFTEHVRFIQTAARHLRLQLPDDVIADFLLFQTATPAIFTHFEGILKIRSIIRTEWLNATAIPQELYRQWEGASASFFDPIETTVEGGYAESVIAERRAKYLFQILKMAGFIQLMIYPQPLVPIKDFMPQKIEGAEIELSDEGMRAMNRLSPLNSDFPKGPAQVNQWIFYKVSGIWSFATTLVDSPSSPTLSSSFRVPLNIPKAPSMQPPFLLLLSQLVDTLAKEDLDEHEAGQWAELQIENAYSIPPKLLHPTGKPSEDFDALMSCSPLLMKLWAEHEPAFKSEAQAVKAALYTFIHTYRTSYKKSFYTLFDPDMREGYAFCSRLNSLGRGSGALDDHPLQRMYSDLETGSDSSVEWLAEFSLESERPPTHRLKIAKVDEEPCIFSASMELLGMDIIHPLLIKYPRFENVEQFTKLMVWQASLVLEMVR